MVGFADRQVDLCGPDQSVAIDIGLQVAVTGDSRENGDGAVFDHGRLATGQRLDAENGPFAQFFRFHVKKLQAALVICDRQDAAHAA
ncbi:hypothetical protein HJO_03530 [Hyphomonas johnsonii MHS-2]|uniref:Uncharacterized protein n=1 Tax=Hyphomonas johnsonii MHS-2 TaxID=1280950 RepID=A0A059FUS3_9PROT|nr:hypothetical protein HJO_03530 [Hyphomonas johnsonii MHS-2]